MKERWTEVESGAKDRQEQQFADWLSGEGIPFESPEAERNYKERITLLKDAIQMQKPPRRVPVCPSAGFFPVHYAGSTHYEAMYDVEAWSGSGRNTVPILRRMHTTPLRLCPASRLISWI
jgi:hypothetical protein